MMSDKTMHKFLKLALLCAISANVACGGCGDEDQSGQNQTGDEVDMTAPEPDMKLEPDMKPAGPEPDMKDPVWPAYLVVDVEPIAALHAPGDEVTPVASVFGTDEQLYDTPVTWSVEPADAAVRGESERWTLQSEGEITFKACAEELGFEEEEICGEFTIVSDAGAPTLVLTSPIPGTEIDGALEPEIIVEGQVTDTFGEPQVFVNMQKVEVAADGTFTTSLVPTFGINHVEVVASDGLNAKVATADLDVLWAQNWRGSASDTTSGTRFEDGLYLELGQRFFDDQLPPVTTMNGAVFTEDLADILTVLLRHIDLTTIIPNPVIDDTDISLSIDALDLGKPTIDLVVTDDGIELFMSAPAMAVDTQGALTLADANLNLTGTLNAGISILASIKIDKPGPDEAFVVEITDIGIAIENASANFMDPQATAIFELAQSALRLQIENVLVDALRSSFIDTIPDLLGDALNSIDTSLAGQTFPLDANLGTPAVDVTFQGKITDVIKEALVGVGLNIDASLVVESAPQRASLGTAMMQPFKPGSVPLLERSRIQIALRLALLNGLLHGLWDANFFEIDATDILPEDISGLIQEARITAPLTPIAAPPTQGEPFDLILHLGQLELTLKTALADQVVRYGVSLSAGLNIGVENNELSLMISDDPQVKIWVIEVVEGTGSAKLSASQLEGLFYSVLWPELTGAIGEGLALPLPVLEIPELSMYAPELADFSLTFDQVGQVVIRDGFVIVDARLRGTLPPPPEIQ